jgi:hypothetical protein
LKCKRLSLLKEAIMKRGREEEGRKLDLVQVFRKNLSA